MDDGALTIPNVSGLPLPPMAADAASSSSSSITTQKLPAEVKGATISLGFASVRHGISASMVH